MPDSYERYLADLASADGMPEAPADPDTISSVLPEASGATAEG